MAFTVSCRNCNNNFKTGYSAKKHHDRKHPELHFVSGVFKNNHGQPIPDEPIAKELKGEELASYKTWLSLLAEQMTGLLNPNAKGKTLKDHKMKDSFGNV